MNAGEGVAAAAPDPVQTSSAADCPASAADCPAATSGVALPESEGEAGFLGAPAEPSQTDSTQVGVDTAGGDLTADDGEEGESGPAKNTAEPSDHIELPGDNQSPTGPESSAADSGVRQLNTLEGEGVSACSPEPSATNPDEGPGGTPGQGEGADASAAPRAPGQSDGQGWTCAHDQDAQLSGRPFGATVRPEDGAENADEQARENRYLLGTEYRQNLEDWLKAAVLTVEMPEELVGLIINARAEYKKSPTREVLAVSTRTDWNGRVTNMGDGRLLVAVVEGHDRAERWHDREDAFERGALAVLTVERAQIEGVAKSARREADLMYHQITAAGQQDEQTREVNAEGNLVTGLAPVTLEQWQELYAMEASGHDSLGQVRSVAALGRAADEWEFNLQVQDKLIAQAKQDHRAENPGDASPPVLRYRFVVSAEPQTWLMGGISAAPAIVTVPDESEA